MDSAGYVRIYDARQNGWIEICDTKSHTKGKSDHHFVVGIGELEMSVRSIFCKGSRYLRRVRNVQTNLFFTRFSSFRYPQTVPKPTIVSLPIEFPLCEPGAEKTKFEAENLSLTFKRRAEEGAVECVNADMDKALNENHLKLFAKCCNQNRETRAMDVAHLMSLSTVKLAITYASKMRKMHLANQLSDLALKMEEEEEELAASAAVTDDDDGKRFNGDEDDVFADDDEESKDEMDNPFLTAANRKSDKNSKLIIMNSQTEKRNPFKKESTGGST